jgi:hypothetical protein
VLTNDALSGFFFFPIDLSFFLVVGFLFPFGAIKSHFCFLWWLIFLLGLFVWVYPSGYSLLFPMLLEEFGEVKKMTMIK